MNVVILGAGYVGLTTGAALAYLGNKVTCLEIDENKVKQLQNGKIPIYEPHLEDLISLTKTNFHFSSNEFEKIRNADVVFITVGTPSLPDGTPDLKQVNHATQKIGENLGNKFTVIVNKSTVPIGSGSWVESLLRDSQISSSGNNFAIASNPEFLREGSAIYDTFYPDRIVIGSDNPKALEVLYNLYKPIVEQTFSPPFFLPRPERLGAIPIITTHLASAELIKYAANSFLALKISFINEIGELAEKVGSDIIQVAKGIGLDSRIGTRFLGAGIGWGGSCFGKDTAAIISTGREYGLPMQIIQAARNVNSRQRERLIEKLLLELKILKGKTIGIMGLAFKPFTDDLRDSPGLDIAFRLIERGAKIKAHDPVALAKAKNIPSNNGITFCNNFEEVAQDSDGIVLATEWPEYQKISWNKIFSIMKNPLIIDGRNFLDKEELVNLGFKYVGTGR